MSAQELVATSIQIPSHLREKIREIAEHEHRSLAGQIRLFLEDAVTRINTAETEARRSNPYGND